MAKSLKDFVSEAKSRIQEVTVDETAKQLQSNPHTLILDVREPGEYGQGHIPGALHIPRGMLEAKADLEFAGREPRLSDRNQPIIVHCASGVRSAFAADVLQQMGFSNVKSLAGGFTAWQQSGKPVEQ
jgi:rhodanese-related sulfurtransferase